MSNHKSSITNNFIFNLLNQILSVLIPCVTVPYLARTLGPASLGEYSFALSLVTYFSLFTNLGLGLYGQRQIAYLRNQPKQEYSKAFWEMVIQRFFIGIISLIIYFFIIVRLSNNFLLSLVLCLEIISTTLDITWLFQGFENFRIIVIRNLVVRILSLIAIFLFVKTPDDVVIYAAILSCSNLIGFASMWLAAGDYVQFVPFHKLHTFSHLKGSFALYLPQVATQVYTVLDRTMLGIIGGSNYENGYYDQAHKIINILIMIVTALGPVLIPRIANLYAEKNIKKIQTYIGKSFSFLWLISFPIIFGIISVANIFVPFFFGPGYDRVIIILKWFVLIIIPVGIGTNIGLQFLVPTGRENYLTKSYVLGAIVNFIINCFVISKWQALGTTLASIAAELVVSGYQLFQVRNQLPISSYFLSARNYIIASVIMFIGLSIMPHVDNISPVLQLSCKVGLGGIIYLMILILLKDPFIYEAKSLIQMKLKK